MTNYTTIEQSRRLVELGLDPTTADMAYAKGFENLVICSPYIENGFTGEFKLPCWSFVALIEILPWDIVVDDIHYELKVDIQNRYLGYVKPFTANYSENELIGYGRDYSEEETRYLIHNLYKLVCWLLENGYIE